jgi:hypothetical protein
MFDPAKHTQQAMVGSHHIRPFPSAPALPSSSHPAVDCTRYARHSLERGNIYRSTIWFGVYILYRLSVSHPPFPTLWVRVATLYSCFLRAERLGLSIAGVGRSDSAVGGEPCWSGVEDGWWLSAAYDWILGMFLISGNVLLNTNSGCQVWHIC